MLNNMLTGPHLLIIIFIIVLLFGAPKLPALARSLGQSMKILKTEVSGDSSADEADKSESKQAGSATKNTSDTETL